MPTKEQPQPQSEGFAFSECERLFYRVSDTRFQAFLSDPQTTIYDVKLSTNTYGEFLFVTTSRPQAQGRESITFFGMGYHDYRDRWITGEWFWYETTPHSPALTQTLPKLQFKQLLDQRRSEITPHLPQATQSAQGKMFETLADIFDEDGAYSALQDMEIWLDDDEASE